MLNRPARSNWKARLLCALLLLAATNAASIYSRPGVATRQSARRPPVARPADRFALRDGDRVVFYGDSITEQRLYTSYVEHYVLTRYPERRVTFVNTGWGGDKVSGNDCPPCAGVGGLARLKRDVIDHRPTVVTLLFGMNDGNYQELDPATLKVYVDGLTAIIRQIKSQTRARIYVLTPTVYDGTRHTSWSHTDRYNEVLDRYSEAAQALAAREGLSVVDFHAATTDALSRAKAIAADYTFLPDGVHPEADGQLVMAAELLRAWGAPVAGAEVAARIIPGATGVSRLVVSAPLPWPPVQPSETLARAAPFVAELGRVRLKMGGTTDGSYSVGVDGSPAKTFNARELSDGINLAELSATAGAASSSLGALVRQRADLFFMRWRQIEVPFAGKFTHAPVAVSSLDALIADLNERERVLAQPHEYHVVIQRAP
ncbi:MAG: SGNH/GDSL hydrolase family protein [Pyrinomonadaceae bacterium]